MSLISWKNTIGWIPPTDADGVDVKSDYAAEVKNWKYGNGFMETDFRPSLTVLPANVQNEITANDYSLLSSQKFLHSTQGTHTFYVLSNGTDLKFYLDNDELNIDEQSSDVTFGISPPKNINYNFVNDQLKINLNSLVKYGADKEVMANLTLLYIDVDKHYVMDLVVKRKGWYLFPRWLGWYQDHIALISDASDGLLKEDFEDANLVSWFTTPPGIWDYSTNSDWNPTPEFAGNRFLVGTNATAGTRYLRFAVGYSSNVRRLKKMLLNLRYINSLGLLSTMKVSTTNSNSIRTLIYENEFIEGIYNLEIDIPTEHIKSGDYLFFEFYLPTPGATQTVAVLSIDNIIITPIKDVSIVAKYDDGQRGLLMSGLSLPVFDDIWITLLKKEIDWRISTYEIYYKINEENIYSLYAEVEYALVWEQVGGTTIKAKVNRYDEEENGIVTLNTNYGLGATIRVDNEKEIYSETVYKGRNYFVKNDNKVYQSHIGGNGLLQPDSFPFDEIKGFGYFITSGSSINKAVSVSARDELSIKTSNKLYIYFIEAGSGIIYRKLRRTTGGIGISSVYSLTKLDSGEPATEGEFWCDYNGIYYHEGGATPPVNLILLSHENYWRALPNSEKDTAVGWYDPVTREYWLTLRDNNGDSLAIIYEKEYNKFRTSSFYRADEFIGLSDGFAYFRATNFIYAVKRETRVGNAILTTHDNTGETEEKFDKILQEVYIIFSDDTEITNVTVQVYADGNYIDSYIFETIGIQRWVAPESVRFNKIKLAVIVAEPKYIRMTNVGVQCTIDKTDVSGRTVVEELLQTGYGYNYGLEYNEGF